MTAAHRGQRPVRLAGYDLGAMWLDSGFEEPFPMEDMDLGELMTPAYDANAPPTRTDDADVDDELEEREQPARVDQEQQTTRRLQVAPPPSQ
jgi:hypothetical protein